MANFTIADLKALREQLGTGMVDTKNALEEADGDVEKAAEILRLKGAKGNAKRADRSTSEGLVAARSSDGKVTLIELACETDFVAKNDNFIALADKVADAAAAVAADSVEAALAAPAGTQTVAQLIDDEAAIIGEKVELRRVRTLSGDKFEVYLHKTSKDLPPQVGVVLGYTGDDAETARSIAQHISFANPQYLTRDEVPRPRSTTSVASSRRSAATRASRRLLSRRSSRDASTRSSSRSPCSTRTTRRTTSCPSPRCQDAGLTVTGFARFKVGA